MACMLLIINIISLQQRHIKFNFICGKIWLQIILFAIAVGVTVHILSYKTAKRD
jgi:nucleoside permease NupC